MANKIKIAGVMRDPRYSPNSVEKDSAIFRDVIEELHKNNVITEIYREEDLLKKDLNYPLIFHLCRKNESVLKLKEIEKSGKKVINPPEGIENCGRVKMVTIMKHYQIPIPESIIIHTEDFNKVKDETLSEYWVKRGDESSQNREDVVLCHNKEDIQAALKALKKRGIDTAVISRNIDGDLVKFYGVTGTSFFYWFYPYEVDHFKFENEKLIESQPSRFTFNQYELKELAERTAKLLNLKVYGGDCIIDREGIIRIIDFNDWPSFSPCRQEAAKSICDLIISSLKEL